MKTLMIRKTKKTLPKSDIWARPQMKITFRAELMPGKISEERTFIIKEVLPSGRVILDGFAGEHRESEFEPVNK